MHSRDSSVELNRNCASKTHGGLTLVEVLVSLTIVSLLVSLALVAVNYSRSSARRVQCKSNLRQIALGAANYEATHKVFPPGSVKGFGPLVGILPFVEQQSVYDQIDFDRTWRDAAQILSGTIIPIYLCPADPASPTISVSTGALPGTNYAGNTGIWYFRGGFDGMFRYWTSLPGEGPPIRASDVSDGLSATALFSEVLRADLSHARLRTNWITPASYSSANELDAFANYCGSLPSQPKNHGWNGSPIDRGTPWFRGNVAATLYNHGASPNRPSCLNQNDMTSALAPPVSLHRGIVHGAFADGRVTECSDHIDIEVWRELGSRAKPNS